MALINSIKSHIENKEIFLTGCTGFFGRSFLDLIIMYNLHAVKLTILSRNPEQFLNNWPKYKALKNLKFIKGDIQNFQFPDLKFDYLLHFATPASATLNLKDPIQMSDVILRGTHHVLDFAKRSGVQKVLFASSGAVYGRQPPEMSHISESYLGAPQVNKVGSAYGEAKRMAELLGCEYSRLYGFEFKIARCFAFCGPHLDRNGTFAIGNFIGDAIKNTSIHLSGDGTPLRSYLYSDDLVVWLLKILIDGNNHEPYNVGSDQAVSIYDLAMRVVKLINPQLQITRAKMPELTKLPERYVPAIDKAKSELGLDVWTDLDSTILKTQAAYKTTK